MLKIHLQVDWLDIVYNANPSKDHSLHFILENQQGQQLNFQRKSISAEQLSYHLDTLCPFQLHMIVGQKKHKVCPFILRLVSKLALPITRVIEMPLSNIFDLYLKQEFFMNIQPLQLDFNFQEGKLTYKVTITDVQTVTDSQQYSHLKSLLAKTDSVISEGKAKISELNTQDQGSKQSSNILKEKYQHEKLYKTQGSAQVFKVQVKNPYLKTYQSFKAMTIEQMAQNVEFQNKRRKMQYQSESQIYQTNLWYIKLSKSDESIPTHSSNIKIKSLICLLVLGFAIMMFDVLNDTDLKKRAVKPLKKNKNKSQQGKDNIKKITKQKKIISK